MHGGSPAIRDLALIGDRRTAAVVARDGTIPWYCPGRFDRPSLLGALLDPDAGGAWRIHLPAGTPDTRCYREDSAVLDTSLRSADGELTITDWMPMGEDCPRGICRLLSPAPAALTVSLAPAPDYGRTPAELREDGRRICINGTQWLYASHPLLVEGGTIRFTVAAGEEAWALLADSRLHAPTRAHLEGWRDATLRGWREVSSHITYHGPYEAQVASSLRALRLLTYEPNGGVIAAATTSLPEVPGGERNYDYRYVWLRDTGMIVSALVRAGSTGPDEQRFLAFICGSRRDDPREPLLPPFVTLDFEPAPEETHLDVPGYAGSRPVRIGNAAGTQLQLDGFANVLLAAKLIYGNHESREHWHTVRDVADFLVEHWREPDYGIWEEHSPRQYTGNKVIVSCGLRYIADFADDAAQAQRWRDASAEIDRYVQEHCINSEGAYAAVAGEEAVDISAVLFPIWGFVEPDAPAMLATMRVLERDHSSGNLYWRHLDELDRMKEGAFLAGTIWVAQYWIMRRDLDRASAVLDAALAYANDLGFFAEEADPASGAMLGNFPQTFAHAAFIGAVVDYRKALEEG